LKGSNSHYETDFYNENRWLYKNTKWRSHFVFLKLLLGLVFNLQKCEQTFVNWYYSCRQVY